VGADGRTPSYLQIATKPSRHKTLRHPPPPPNRDTVHTTPSPQSIQMMTDWRPAQYPAHLDAKVAVNRSDHSAGEVYVAHRPPTIQHRRAIIPRSSSEATQSIGRTSSTPKSPRTRNSLGRLTRRFEFRYSTAPSWAFRTRRPRRPDAQHQQLHKKRRNHHTRHTTDASTLHRRMVNGRRPRAKPEG